MDKNNIIELYKSWKSMRQIALEVWTNHKLISRILKWWNIETRKPMNLRWKKKFEDSKERLYNNMAKHLRFDIDHKWLMQFEDINKVKVLNKCISMRDKRWRMNTEWYKEYLLKFYYNEQFNLIYVKWIESWYNYYMQPSIDHINPKANWWDNNIDNLQFLTWFENRCKNDMNQEEWNLLKNNIDQYFIWN